MKKEIMEKTSLQPEVGIIGIFKREVEHREAGALGTSGPEREQ